MREFSVFTKNASVACEGAEFLSQALCAGVVQNPRSFSSITAANPQISLWIHMLLMCMIAFEIGFLTVPIKQC